MSSPQRPRFADYRARLDALGFRPSRARGQNFLLDPTLHRWIVDAADPGPADLVLEIGVGLGFLTRELSERAGRVVGVEIDDRLCRLAGQELSDRPNVALILADALGGKGRRIAPEVVAACEAVPADGRLLVVANLPYSVSGPLLAELTCLVRLPDRAVVLVQREMAQRCAAAPGRPDYGGLAALIHTCFAAKLLRTVPAEVFRPRPKVVSAVLRLDRRGDLPLPESVDRRFFGAFVRQVFGQRRKTLRAVLPRVVAAIDAQRRASGRPVGAFTSQERMAALGGELLATRAEVLSGDELVALWRQLGGGQAG